MSEDEMFYCSFVSIHYIICECGETFPTEDALKGHLEKEHPHKKERKEYKCGVCELVFSTEQQCIDHYEASHIDVKTEHDYGDTEAQSDTQYEEVYTYCDEEGYQQIKREIISTSICEVCGEVYLEGYKHTCLSETEKEELVEKETNPKRLKNKKIVDPSKKVCEVCGKKYASNAALRYHQRVHTGERPYKCTMCNKTFTMPLFLQIHVRTHTGEKPYVCTHPQCDKAFSNKAALLRHDRVHTGIKPYKCPQCGKFFTQSNSMKLHVHTVHLKMPAPYKSRRRRSKFQMGSTKKDQDFAVDDNTVSLVSEPLAEAEMHVVKQTPNLYQVQEGDVLYEEDIDKEVTYEIVYEDQ